MPGPGSYDAVLASDTPAFSLSRRTRVARADSGLDPGLYTPSTELVFERSRYATITGKGSDLTRTSNTPGPGTYLAKTTLGDAVKWKFSQDQRLKHKTSDTPGPGTYKPASIRSEGAYSLGRRHHLKRGTALPGPGAYDPKKSEVTAQVSLDKSPRRLLAEPSPVPGPGTYTPEPVKTRASIRCTLSIGLEAGCGQLSVW